MRPKRLHVKMAIAFLLAVAMLVIGVYFLHEYQVKRTAVSMLARAAAAARNDEPDEAIRCYRHYVNYAPGDYEAYSRLALLIADQADRLRSNPKLQVQAMFMLERAARQDPDNMEVTRRLVEFSMKLRRMSDAVEHIQRLLQATPDDSQLEVELGRCYIATEKYREAISALESAIAHDAGNLDAYMEVARLYREQLDDAEQADLIIDQMVASNTGQARAYI